MKKIALIPIDNRPVCYKLIKQIIGLSKEHQLFMPDISYMGGLKKNAQILKKGLYKTAEECYNDCDYL